MKKILLGSKQEKDKLLFNEVVITLNTEESLKLWKIITRAVDRRTKEQKKMNTDLRNKLEMAKYFNPN